MISRPGCRNGCGRGSGAASGFTSTLAHAGGPPITIYLWPKKIDRMQFMAITVVFFTVVNAVETDRSVRHPRPTEPEQPRHLRLVLMPSPHRRVVGVRPNDYINDRTIHWLRYHLGRFDGTKCQTTTPPSLLLPPPPPPPPPPHLFVVVVSTPSGGKQI